ncbi:MAG: AgmX/PglI C-terminal domain-containing protein [Kangiellaceae bacterium]|nr:AgmX/PglI C-terminal domain-containing protein [Kangiellaceae bacterium]
MASYLLRSIVDPILPWDTDEQENARYNKILIALIVLSLILSIIIPYIEIEKSDRNKRTTIPPRLVKMVLEQKKKEVKPPPPIEQPKEEEPEPEPEKEEEKPKEEEPKPEPEKKTAKEVAKKHIAVFDALADLRDPDDMEDLRNNQSLSNDTGKAAEVTRSLITKKATQGSSGGIRVATASKSSGTGTLAGQNTTNVKSEIGSAVANLERKDRSGNTKRSSENIQLAFEKAKPRIFSIYNRALRKDPSLQGTVTFKLTIRPDGTVSKCTITKSDLNNPELEKRIVRQIKKIKFGAMDVATIEIDYPINFFPS